MVKNVKEVGTKIVICLLIVCVVTSCGRIASPVSSTILGDKVLPCETISLEIADNNKAISELRGEVKGRRAKNIILGITGFFLIVPLFFMDFGSAAETEIIAFQKRNSALKRLAGSRDCEATY